MVGSIVGRKTADFVNRHRMAILLATLVLLVLASPIGDVVSQARLVLAGATVAFMLASLQQADAYPRLRLPSRLMVLFWLILTVLPRWSEEAWARRAAVTLATVVLSVLWLVAQRLVKARGSARRRCNPGELGEGAGHVGGAESVELVEGGMGQHGMASSMIVASAADVGVIERQLGRLGVVLRQAVIVEGRQLISNNQQSSSRYPRGGRLQIVVGVHSCRQGRQLRRRDGHDGDTEAGAGQYRFFSIKK